MAIAPTTRATNGGVVPVGPVSVIDIDDHKRELASIRAEQKARRPELLKCCNPDYARQRELEKPNFVWTIEAKWYQNRGRGVKHYHKKASVIAKNETDAWSAFCDKFFDGGTSPDRRDVEIKFNYGKQVSVAQVAAETNIAEDHAIPRVEFQSKHDPKLIDM